jgi:hypothetical protein
MKYSPIAKQGIRNAMGILAYVCGVALFFSNAQNLFGAEDPKGPWIPVMMLLLLIVSALITGSLALWQPLKLLVDGKKSEAGTLLCITGASLLCFLLITGTILAVVH